MKTVEQYLLQLEANRKKVHKTVSILSVLSLFVVTAVFWNLRLTGITIANSAMCGIEEHFHSDECLNEEQPCELEEHIHTFSCYSDASADVETPEIWEATLPELSEDKADNVVKIALSQVDYTESDDNFVVLQDTEIRNGITRYGQWYGNSHGDWANMFTAFCLTYAGVYEVPMNSGAEAMRLEWLEKNIYQPLGNYEPISGDVLFIDNNQNGIADATAIIISNDGVTLQVVQGDVEDVVVETSYDIAGGQVLGYGVIEPETKVLMTTPSVFALNDAPIIANTVNYSSSIFNANSQYVIYTKTSDNKYYAIDGNSKAVEIYIDSSGVIRSDVANVNDLYWTITASNTQFDNRNGYFIQNVGTRQYLHPYKDNSGQGPLLSGRWATIMYEVTTNNIKGVKFRGFNQNQYPNLSGDSFSILDNRNNASIFYFGRIETCTLWLDGTNGDIMSNRGSNNTSYSVMRGGTFTLPKEWATPSKYYYKLNGWVDIQTGNYYAPGDEITVMGNTVLYADWVANTYDIGQYNSHVVDTVSTNDFITTKVFDYNSLFNMLTSSVSVSVSNSSHSEAWSHVANGNVTYKNQPTLNFAFNDHDSSGKITNPNNLNAENTYTGGGVYEGIYNTKLGDALFNEDTAINSETGEGIVGKHYLGEGDHLFQFETDPTDEYFGYYYYDAKKNATSYNQSEQRFYVYNYLERTSDSSKETDGTQYSDFVPLNSPYENNPNKNITNYNYGGVNGEYRDVVHYQYDSRYTENDSSESNIITNFWFGMSVEIDFYLPNVPGTLVDGEYGNKDVYGNDMHFEFAGDDDVWILIDDQVVLDIGGIHKAEGGDINFSTGTVTNGNSIKQLTNITSGEHKLTIYYLERGSSMSNCAMYFNLAPRYLLTLQKEDVFTQKALDGAKFTIYTDAACTKGATVWSSKQAYLNKEASKSTFVIENGKLTAWGLGASNTYYIKETSPPTNGGYSSANGIIKLTLDKNGVASYAVEMLEQTDQYGNKIPISNGFTVHGFKIDEEKQEAYLVVTNAQSWVTETTSIYVEKKWKDSKDHSYDYVTAYLNIIEGDSVRQIREITLNQSNDWKYIWVNLPKYDQEGKLINYSVSESYFPGYAPQIEKLETGIEADDWEVVEAYNFVDGETYILKTNQGYISAKNTTENILKYVDEKTAKESNLAKWTVSVNGNNITLKNGNGMYLNYHHNTYWSGNRYFNLSNLATNFMVKQSSTGLSIYYTSNGVAYYLTGINTNGTGASNTSNQLLIQPMIKSKAIKIDGLAYRITNIPLDQETSLKVTKKWQHPTDDSIYYEQEQVTVHLLANGLKIGRTVTLSLKNNWTDTFKGLPYKDSNGNVIVYTVIEGGDLYDWIPVYDPIDIKNGSIPIYETSITNHYRWTGEVELPATGGLGYPIFILIGSILVVGPFVYSFKMRKMHERRYNK